MTPQAPAIEEVIDLDRYPIHDPDHPRTRALLAHCRGELRAVGCSSVPDFFRPEAVAAAAAMVEAVADKVHRPPEKFPPYANPGGPELPADHPRRQVFTRGGGFICADFLDPASGLWRFYDWPETTAFMEAAFEVKPLYQYADPLANMPINALWAGDGFPWHFDTNEMTVSVMLTQPMGGGIFEYVPNIRAPGAENYERVKRLFAGDRSGVRQLALRPGDMQLFKGRFTAHRVTAVEGPVPRYVALPSWCVAPGQVGVPGRMINSYGRALPIHYAKAG